MSILDSDTNIHVNHYDLNSRWACEAWHLEHASVVLEDTEYPMLWTIFRCLARLYGAPVVPLFVCSSTEVPGPRLNSSPVPVPPGHPFFEDMRCFVEAFGFVWHQVSYS